MDWIYEIVCPHLPLQRKIVFDNFGGRGMGDDPKYIALYIKEHHPDIKLIWLLSDMNTPMPDGITPVFIYSRKARYHLYTAKIWVDNIKSFKKTPKRKGQFYLQTWHAGIADFKKVEAQTESTLSLAYVNAAKFDAKITDLMYTNCDFTKSIFENFFWYNGIVIKCDLPRINVLVKPPSDLKLKITNNLKISKKNKIVLYAPTFRVDKDLSVFLWDYDRVLDVLSSKYGGNFLMLLRLHPNVANQQKDLKYNNRVLPVSNYPDMQELLLLSDMLITDYSSCMFEFSVMKKPVFLYAPDYDLYSHQERGLVFKPEEIPFTISYTQDELCQTILDFEKDVYCKKLKSFWDMIGYEDTGDGAKKISELIIQQI